HGQDSPGDGVLQRRPDQLRGHARARQRTAQRDPEAGRQGTGHHGRDGGDEAVSARGAARGFTLIEVLVALAIVVIGMATIMGALSSSANSVSYLRDRTFGQWVALNQIANVRLSASLAHQQPSAGDTNGDTDFAGRSWHWRQVVAATEIPGVVRIDVS